jgi:hypothetical protein
MEMPTLPTPVLGMYLVGSTAIYGSGADIDLLVLVTDRDIALTELKTHGWVMDGSYPGDDFTSVRKDSVNLIITHHSWMVTAFVVATDTMKALAAHVPASDKPTRLEVHRVIREACRPPLDIFA